MTLLSRILPGLLVAVLWGGLAEGYAQNSLPPNAPQALRQFDTDLTNATVDLSTLRHGGPSKHGIP